MLILYLWNSFWTSIFYIIFLIFLFWHYNTLNFKQVYLVYNINNWYVGTLLFCSISLKLGLPAFHFLKIQLYFNLDSRLIFVYSIITVFINLFIFIFILVQPVVILLAQHTSFLWVCSLFGSLVFINIFKTWNVVYLLLFSAVTVLIIFMFILL